MTGMQAVQAHIAMIQARFQPRPADASSTAGATSSATSTTATETAGSDFDQLLAKLSATAAATGSTGAPAPGATGASIGSTAALTPADKLATGAYGALQAPAELRAYGNGQIPTSALAAIGIGDHKLWAPAATAFQQMRAAATADGVSLGVNDSYRDLAAQQRMAAEKGLYSQGGLAAVPGTSPHGWGLALDLQLDTRAQAWMRENGHRYGFVEDVAREPWHWTYRPRTA